MSNLLNIKDQNGNWIPIPVVTNGIKSITQNEDYTLTITLNDGTTYTTTSIKGEDGRDYILTENDKQDIAGLVDTPVDDVQINGTSIVSDGVAEIPIASASLQMLIILHLLRYILVPDRKVAVIQVLIM